MSARRHALTLPPRVYLLQRSRPIGTGRVRKDKVSGAMETNLLCHHADLCVKPAVYTCAGCQGHFCGDHFLRASFSGPGLTAAPTIVDTCHTCLARVIAHHHQAGRTLRQWHKRGGR
jgi:hypothetical protein